MVTFSFREYGENLGTRPLGKRVREQLLPPIKQNSCVVLDFTGVNVVSNSFADECIAKLLLEMPHAELRSRTTFKGLNPIANDSVLTALRRRHLTIKNYIRIYRWVTTLYVPLAAYSVKRNFVFGKKVESDNILRIKDYGLLVKIVHKCGCLPAFSTCI